MTERDVFVQAVPQIAEMVVEARKLTDEEFAQWKSGVLQDTPERIRPFIEKIYVVIEESLYCNTCALADISRNVGRFRYRRELVKNG